jgi:carboxylesterase type B
MCLVAIQCIRYTHYLHSWQAPKDKKKLKAGEVLDATRYGATCPQAISGTTYSQQSEDCLNLNIWVPSSKGANVSLSISHTTWAYAAQ